MTDDLRIRNLGRVVRINSRKEFWLVGRGGFWGWWSEEYLGDRMDRIAYAEVKP